MVTNGFPDKMGRKRGEGKVGAGACIMTMEVLETDLKASRSMTQEMSFTSSSPRYSFRNSLSCLPALSVHHPSMVSLSCVPALQTPLKRRADAKVVTVLAAEGHTFLLRPLSFQISARKRAIPSPISLFVRGESDEMSSLAV